MKLTWLKRRIKQQQPFPRQGTPEWWLLYRRVQARQWLRNNLSNPDAHRQN